MPQGTTRATTLKSHAQELSQDRQNVMPRVGRHCRGPGKIFVQRVRHTETRRLEGGNSSATLAQAAHQALQQAAPLRTAMRECLARALSTAQEAHQQIRTQSRRLTPGKTLPTVKSSMPTPPPLLRV
jgi:hypothetical protein